MIRIDMTKHNVLMMYFSIKFVGHHSHLTPLSPSKWGKLRILHISYKR